MNAVEFLFAFCTVFGVSGFWFLWTKFVYDLDKRKEELEEDIYGNSRIINKSSWQSSARWKPVENGEIKHEY